MSTFWERARGLAAAATVQAQAAAQLARATLDDAHNETVKFTLEEEIEKAASILARLANGGPDAEIPAQIVRECAGVAVLRVVKLGLGLSARVGSGVVVARAGAAHEWSAPCAIGTAGAGWGLQAGAQIEEVVLVIRTREALALFCSCLLYTSPSPRDRTRSRMPSSA